MEYDNESGLTSPNPPIAGESQWRKRWRGMVAGSAAGIMVASGVVVATLGLSAGNLANSPEAVATTVRATPDYRRPQYTAQAPMTPGQTECDPNILRAACSPSRPPAQQGTSSSSEGASAMAWFNKAKGPFSAIQSALQSASKAMEAQDIGAVQAACRQVLSNSQRLGNTLPSPDSGLTSEVQGAVDELTTAANMCLGANPTGNGEAIMSHVQNANAHFSAAQQIIESKS